MRSCCKQLIRQLILRGPQVFKGTQRRKAVPPTVFPDVSEIWCPLPSVTYHFSWLFLSVSMYYYLLPGSFTLCSFPFSSLLSPFPPFQKLWSFFFLHRLLPLTAPSHLLSFPSLFPLFLRLWMTCLFSFSFPTTCLLTGTVGVSDFPCRLCAGRGSGGGTQDWLFFFFFTFLSVLFVWLRGVEG